MADSHTTKVTNAGHIARRRRRRNADGSRTLTPNGSQTFFFLLYLSSGKTKPISFFIFSCCVCVERDATRERDDRMFNDRVCRVQQLFLSFLLCWGPLPPFVCALFDPGRGELQDEQEDEEEEGEEQLAQEGGHTALLLFFISQWHFPFLSEGKKGKRTPNRSTEGEEEEKKCY